MTEVTEVFVPGRPAPQGSKSISRTGHMYESSRHLKPWREAVEAAARSAGAPLLDGPVVAGMEFVMPRPAATPKTRPTPPAVKRPDIEKLARAVSDALTGVVFADDSQVTAMPLAKRIAALGEVPGVRILLARSDPATDLAVATAIYRP